VPPASKQALISRNATPPARYRKPRLRPLPRDNRTGRPDGAAARRQSASCRTRPEAGSVRVGADASPPGALQHRASSGVERAALGGHRRGKSLRSPCKQFASAPLQARVLRRLSRFRPIAPKPSLFPDHEGRACRGAPSRDTGDVHPAGGRTRPGPHPQDAEIRRAADTCAERDSAGPR